MPVISASTRLALRLAGLEQLGDTREAVGDVLARDTAGVEGTHGELGAGLADRLGGDDAHRGADVDDAAGREVPAVAVLAHAVLRVAGHDRANLDFLDARIARARSSSASERDVVARGLERPRRSSGLARRCEQAAAHEVVVHAVRALRVHDRERHALRRCRSRPRG